MAQAPAQPSAAIPIIITLSRQPPVLSGVKLEWVSAPSVADLAALYPEQARASHISGRAIAACVLAADGSLTGCVVRTETPDGYGFGSAALKATHDFKVTLATRTGPLVAGRRVMLDLRWPAPTQPDVWVVYEPVAAATVPPPASLAPRPSRPDWERQPNGDDLAAVFPDAAKAQHANGHTKMQCRVTAKGTLTSCEIIEETPAGLGFARAALMVSPLFKMRPKTADGAPVEGGTVIIPISWSLVPE
jgi:outer membrane biosynthesis protein TonB